MNTKTFSCIMLVPLVCLISFFCFPYLDATEADWPPAVGERYPDLSLIDEKGDAFKLSSLKGKLILVEFSAMTCPATQALNGAHQKGSYGETKPQAGVPIVDRVFELYTDGIEPYGNEDIAFVQVIAFDQTASRAPSPSELAKWIDHFGLRGRKNYFTFTTSKELQISRSQVPGFHLIDRDFFLRSDATGANQALLYSELLPSVGSYLSSSNVKVATGKSDSKVMTSNEFQRLVERTIQNAMDQSDFDAIEKMLQSERENMQFLAGGESRLHLLYTILEKGTAQMNFSNIPRYTKFLDAWEKKHQRSVAAKILRAELLSRQAWTARGHGYVNAVSEDNLEKFTDLNVQAWNELQLAIGFGVQDPHLHVARISVGGPIGMCKHDILGEVEYALNIEPRYIAAPMVAVVYLLPRWGGQANDITELAKTAKRLGGLDYGGVQYFKTVKSAVGYLGNGILSSQSELSWDELSNGFRQLQEVTTDSDLHWNQFARVAHAFNQREAAREAFQHIDSSWGKSRSGVWGSRSLFNQVRDWANQDFREESAGLVAAVRAGNMLQVIRLLYQGENIDEEDVSGNTPLLISLKEQRKDISAILLLQGASATKSNENGYSPLHFAARFQQKNIMDALIAKGADVNAATKQGSTPLHFAAGNGSVGMISYLIEQGADVQQKNRYGETAMHYAARSGQPNALQVLLEKDESLVHGKDGDHRTPLFAAAAKGDTSIVNYLLAQGADANVQDTRGRSALDYAREKGHSEIVAILSGN